MTPETQRNLAVGALVVLTLVAAVAMYRHNQWMKKNCKCGAASAFYGGGGYAEPYRCGPGLGAGARPYPHPNKGASCCPFGGGAAAFTADVDHWPTSGTVGNLADTNPYANYSGHADMYYPTYTEGYAENVYWTRT